MRHEEKPAKETVEKRDSGPKEHHWQSPRGKEGLGTFESSRAQVFGAGSLRSKETLRDRRLQRWLATGGSPWKP